MQSSEMPTEEDDWKKRRQKKGTKGYYRLECRWRQERFIKMWPKRKYTGKWSLHWQKYKTEARREMAMKALNKKNTIFEFRIPKGASHDN